MTMAGIPPWDAEYTYRQIKVIRKENIQRRPRMVGCANVRDAAVVWKLVLESCFARPRVQNYLTPSIP